VIRSDGVIDGSLAARNPRIHADGRTFSYRLHDGGDGRAAIRITQNDVRAIQLAKAALYAGVQLLMENLGVERVDRIRLAGAFGSHIDVKYAMVLGLIPDCALEQVSSAGNAAGTGARMALLDQRARATVESLVRRIEKIETAVAPRFQEFFVEAMAIPHLKAPYPRLRAVMAMPAPVAKAQDAPRRRARADVARLSSKSGNMTGGETPSGVIARGEQD